MRTKIIIALTFILIGFTACKKDAVELPLDFKYEYQPTAQGNWIEYQVDSIAWNGIFAADTFQFRVKIMTDSIFLDNTNRTTYRLIKFVYNNESSSWEAVQASFIVKTETTLEKFENNLKTVKLIFPVKKNQSWDINAYNELKQNTAKYSQVDIVKQLNNHIFDSCAVVTIDDEYTLIAEKSDIEIYAKNVGMVARNTVNVETEIDGTITKGYKCNYTYLNHGKN